LTCIDKASNLVKLIRIDDETAVTSSLKVGFVDTPILYDTYMTKEGIHQTELSMVIGNH
jgi:hypothetical protein